MGSKKKRSDQAPLDVGSTPPQPLEEHEVDSQSEPPQREPGRKIHRRRRAPRVPDKSEPERDDDDTDA